MDIFKKLEVDFSAQQTILNLVSQIDQFKGKWEITIQGDSKYLKELKKIAAVESIGSSTRIEGVQMTDKEIGGLLKNIKLTQLKTRDEQEVAGYYEALQIIMDNYAEIPLTESQIKNLHNVLLRFSSKDEHHRGNYKRLTNKVVANYPDGEQRVIFQTTEPHLTEPEMYSLVKWTNEELSKGALHPLLNIAAFVYEFLSIHPFQDGNGRLARLLTTLLLLKGGYLYIQYISFEQVIEERKKEYYEALMHGQKNRNKDEERIDQWILFFLGCLKTLTERLEMKYSRYQSKGGYVNERQKNIFEFIKAKEPVKLNDINTAFESVSVNTIKKDLLYLKTENYIEAVGVKKGTVYVIKK